MSVDDILDAEAGWSAIMFLLLSVRLFSVWKRNPSFGDAWRDFAVIGLSASSAIFWSLIAMRRWFDWSSEVAIAAFTLKAAAVTLVTLHVYTHAQEE